MEKELLFWSVQKAKQLEQDLISLTRRLQQLEQAMVFYADSDNYSSDPKAVMVDSGAKARAALGGM